mgnify:CR=1 FL=1
MVAIPAGRSSSLWQRCLSLDQTMQEVRASLTASLEAGYRLLHIDPTVDRTLPPGAPVPIDTVVARTADLIAHTEAERRRLMLPPVDYEVGTEEVHGGLVDFANFERFITGLRAELAARDLLDAWPCFIVAKVGTDLHTTFFDPETAGRLYDLVAPHGSLVKGHYTDWVENPAAYPETGMGGANVGPEFTAEEVLALADLCAREETLLWHRADGRNGSSPMSRGLTSPASLRSGEPGWCKLARAISGLRRGCSKRVSSSMAT